ncbi:SgcJ/EcaC family oxidoreductase [Saccharothrix sp.]|uniref:SgcJ/EcaC family oxidoreductase n=1 Tax=Saccharothrix sp. TaxID=1873460 RepID=UPI0028115687|nr:SgcJ/EcaC family oxidoreductase [Saccharothrix sp.]
MSSATTPRTRSAEAGVREVLDGVARAWAGGDADAVADACAKNARMVLSDDRFLRGREMIRTAMTREFATADRGRTLVQDVVDLRFLQPGVAVVVTEGGDLVAEERRPVRATWVLANGLDGWRIAAYQNSRIAGETPPGA